MKRIRHFFAGWRRKRLSRPTTARSVGLISETHQAFLRRMAAQAPYPAYNNVHSVGLISETHQAFLRRMAAQAPYPAYNNVHSVGLISET
ncbi:hypothetical protein ACRQQF_23725, partial [Citrobacter arsenatis]|uniref:hypothetical protein n=1 Tax=Citrobacter arsenatis TaxID=2546350 RepID=UPI003D7FB685